MDWALRVAECSVLLLLVLVATRLGRHADGAGKPVIEEAAQHGLRDWLNLWAMFIGFLLIAVFCWLLATSILGDGWPASCVALCIFFGIGVNVLDDECCDSEENPKL
jgi:hypothetical protein